MTPSLDPCFNLPVGPALRVQVTQHLDAFRQAFVHHDPTFGAVWGALALIALAALVAHLLRRRLPRTPHPAATPLYCDPDQLFEDLLHELALASPDRRLLRQLARGARLRHPVQSLLSPALLGWSCQLWLAEKGPHSLTPDKRRRLEAISVALYDHLPPAWACLPSPAGATSTPCAAPAGAEST